MTHTAQRAALPGQRLQAIQAALRKRGLAGWLVWDFRGMNPVGGRLLGLNAPLSRRYFAWIPSQGEPIVLAHPIERAPWVTWPGPVLVYRDWRHLESELRSLLGGKGRIALEYVPRNTFPAVDRVPAGLMELLRDVGVELVSSADLITLFLARWSSADLAAHRRAAAHLAEVARNAFREVRRALPAREPMTEWTLKCWVLDRMAEAGLYDVDTTVAAGVNSADPHYEPSRERHAPIEPDQVLLIDLWGRYPPDSVFADQTWMGFTGPRPPADVVEVWDAVRDARDHGIAFLRERLASGQPVRGCDVDRATRGRIVDRGYGEWFPHRTGHSIDRDLHGSGPNLDSLETEDTRTLETDTAYSVEPGVYLEGRFGMRSEVNVILTADGVEVTPDDPQTALHTI